MLARPAGPGPRFAASPDPDSRLGAPLRLLLLLGLTLLLPHPAAGQARPPNIVFILADDLGIHDLHAYGRSDHRTPHLDRLAAEGTRFTSAYCALPICSPSRAAILTGLAPARLHLTTFLPGRPDQPSQRVLHPVIESQLPRDLPTLAQLLKRAGYATACLGKWHLGGGPAEIRNRGFDMVCAGRPNTEPSEVEGGKGEFDLTDRAIQFIEQHRQQPFFLYLAHHSPHIPYNAQRRLIKANTGAFEPVYAALIESLDESVGRLVSRLDALGLGPQTLVIFTSDNGGLHVPELRHARITHNGPFRAGKGFLYEGGLRIPLIIRWPGRLPANRVADEPMSNTDWFPTLLELAGQSVPPGLDGRSVVRWLTGRGQAPRRTLYWHFPHYTNQGGRPGGAVRDGRWKYLESYDGGEPELYDLQTDPGERHNLAAAQPRRVQRLRQRLDAWRQQAGAQTNRPNPQVNEPAFQTRYIDFDPSRFEPTRADDRLWRRAAEWRKAMDTVPTP